MATHEALATKGGHHAVVRQVSASESSPQLWAFQTLQWPTSPTSAVCALTQASDESPPSSGTDTDAFTGLSGHEPLTHGEIDLERQGALGKDGDPPLGIRMPPWLQPYVAEGCGIAVLVIFGLVTNMYVGPSARIKPPR